MKIFDTLFRGERSHTSLMKLFFIAAAVLITMSSLPAQPKRAYSKIEREMNAREAMRVAQRRHSELFRTPDSKYLSSKQSQVEIKLNAAQQTASTVFLFDNMESGVNGWTTELIGGSTDNLWHQTGINDNSFSTSWYCAIDGQTNYATGRRINTALVSPSVDLSTAIAPVSLVFAESYFTEFGWDYCMIDISNNGGASWTPLRGAYGSAPSGDSKGWIISTLNLSSYVGSQILLRFHFDTGDTSFNQFPGWFVDDVLLFDQGGMIMGRKFFDVNSNGTKDLEDRGIKDWLITATGPVTLTVRTNDRGRFIMPLPLGTYTVSENLKPGWTQTSPPGGTWSIDVATPDTLVDSVWFMNHTDASLISGIKFNDVNRDGMYNGGDSILADWKIDLTDTSGIELDYDKTDSLGQYMLYVFQPGEYRVSEDAKPGWVQSFPDSFYHFMISDLSTVITGQDFGNYYSDSVNTLIGQKFNDLNRNNSKDDHEPGVPGFEIKLQGPKPKLTRTDSSGFYKFLSVPAGTHKIMEFGKQGWWQSYPDSYYTITCYQGELIDTLDFGNYEIVTSSISGMKFYDANNNGIKDDGEPGLPNWKINLSGMSGGTVITSGSGNYSFTGLWPGNYSVGETPKVGWTQTYPANFAPHSFYLGPEENKINIDFGNIDSAYLGSYRSFLPESLAFGLDKKGKHKPIPLKPDKDEFQLNFVNQSASPVKKLTVRLSIPPVPGTVTSTQPGTITLSGDNLNIVEVLFDASLQPNDSLKLYAIGKKPVLQKVKRWWWTFENDLLSAKDTSSDFRLNLIRLPMPNTVNAMQLVGTGLRVGVGGPHSIVHRSYKDILKSLVEGKDRMALGIPRCLDKFTGGRSIKREQRYLTPTRHNNMMLAAAIALKVNIATSDQLITPPGFGDLLFDEGTGPANPMNDMSVRNIAATLDTYMSAFNETTKTCSMPLPFGSLDPETLYAKIQKINGAFSGPLDTVSFSNGLVFTGVSQLSSVPFLRYDTSAAVQHAYQQNRTIADVPEEFILEQNFPNPFNPTTVIQFYLPYESFVTLKVYNTLGQEVATVLNKEEMTDGSQEIEFSSSAYNLASGVYFYRLVAETIDDDEETGGHIFTSVKKMVLLK